MFRLITALLFSTLLFASPALASNQLYDDFENSNSEGDSFTGTETWRWSGEGFQCSGTSELSGSLDGSRSSGDSSGGGSGGCFISAMPLERLWPPQ